MKTYDIAVIGAGAAGMMAAITASENGKRVVLIDRNAQLGRKLLATGNGRCNLTNKFVAVDRFHGSNPAFIDYVVSEFDQYATLKLFEDMGLIVKEEDNGRMFPRTNQASSVVEVMRQRLVRNRVEILLDAQVVAIEHEDVWSISMNDRKPIQSNKLIIATGGRAAHHFGSTGDGLYWAQKLGHSLTPIHAALVPVETVETWPHEIQGVKVEASVWTTCKDEKIGESTSDLLFTSYGVSGPSVMALAGHIAPLLKSSEVNLHIDLFPDMNDEELDQIVIHNFQNSRRITVGEALVGVIPGSMITVVAKLAGVDAHKSASEVSRRERLRLVRMLKDLSLTVSKLRPLKEAQVSAGGVKTEEINTKTLESKLVKNLYFAGEMLDVDGDSGGFNLQWAWSSGRLAGMTLTDATQQ